MPAPTHAAAPHDEPLLATKLAPPPLRAALTRRTRLSARLDAAAAHTLALIVAPAGSGKTTLLASWLRQGGQGPAAAWLSLDAADDDPARFWRYLLAAVERAAPELAAAALARLGGPGERVEPALTLLLNAVAARPPLLLVLDDYHLIRAPAIHAGVGFLLDHAPPGLCLLIASRSAPPLALERLRVRGLLLEIGPADLRFSEAEAAALLSESLGLALDQGALAALVARTEGWAAGLVLAGLAARNRAGDLAEARDAASPLVLDYVTAEVLRGQPAAVERFLLATAPLERFSAELCDAVLAAVESAPPLPPSQLLIDEIERRGLFLQPLDDARRWFRYHQLFAEALRAQVARVAPEQLRATRLAAAAWFAERGLPAEAAGYALAAEAWERAVPLVVEAGYAALLRGETAAVRAWLDALPPERRAAHAALPTLDGWLRIVAGDLAGAAAQVELARAAAPDPGLADELRAMAAIVAVLGGDLSGGLELAALPAERLPRGAFVGAVEAIARGLHAEFHGDVAAAADAYRLAARLSDESGSLLVGFLACCQLGEVQLLQGRLRDAEASYVRADALRRRDPGTARAVGDAAKIGLGAVAFERGAYAQAEALIRAALAGGTVLGDVAAVEARVYLAQCAAARGELAGAAAELEAARRLSHSSFDSMLPIVEALQATLDLRRGDLGRAAAWLVAAEPGLAALPEGLAEAALLSRARVLTALGRPDEALAALDALAARAERAGRGRSLIELQLARADALAAKGRDGAARAAAERAAALAAPEGFVAVLELGRLVAPPARTPGPAAPLPPGGHALTDRELEVLRLIAAGLGNEAIAARLVVAPGTVKKHVNRLFAKLEATSRTQAIVRGRALGLLE